MQLAYKKDKVISAMVQSCNRSLGKKATMHQLTTMLATSKNVLFPGHNHLLITNTDVPSLVGARVIIKVSGHQYQSLEGGYGLEMGNF